MRSNSSLPVLGLLFATAVFLVAFVLLTDDFAYAADSATSDSATAASQGSAPLATPPGTVLALPAPRSRSQVAFDDSDAVAALDALDTALSEVGDGGTYVWRRRDGQLSGTARPTSSFKSASGQPCRHLVVTLQSRDRTRSLETIACRLPDKRWQLDG